MLRIEDMISQHLPAIKMFENKYRTNFVIE